MPLTPRQENCGFPSTNRSSFWWPLLLSRLLSPLPPSPKTPESSGPLMRSGPLQRVKLREATATQHLRFRRYLRLAGLTSPDFATPAGFLNLLTSCSSRSPSSLISCWWRSWASAFEVFPSPVAVPSSRASELALHRGPPVCRFSARRRKRHARLGSRIWAPVESVPAAGINR